MGRETGIIGEIREGPSRNMYKGPMDKAKGDRVEGGAGGIVGGKWKQLYLNNNKKHTLTHAHTHICRQTSNAGNTHTHMDTVLPQI